MYDGLCLTHGKIHILSVHGEIKIGIIRLASWFVKVGFCWVSACVRGSFRALLSMHALMWSKNNLNTTIHHSATDTHFCTSVLLILSTNVK